MRRRAGREEKPRVALADALDLDGAARLDLDVLAQLLARDRADVDAAGDRRALEPRREVYGVAPDVVAELLASDDAGHDRPRRQPHAHVQVVAGLGAELADGVLHGKRHMGQAKREVGRGLGDAGRDHVGIADGLDLLDAVALGQAIEHGDQRVQHRYGLAGAEAARERHEARDVGKEDRRLGERVGHGLGGLGLQPLDNGVRQDVAQERVGLGLGVLGQAEGIEDGGGDKAECRDGRLRVERIEHVLLGGNGCRGWRKPEPARKVQQQRDGDRGNDQPHAPEAEDDEGRRREGDVLDMQARVAAEVVGEGQQGGAFGHQDQERRRHRPEAVHEGDGGHDDHDGEVDVDDRPVAIVVDEGLLHGIDQRRDHDQVGDHVQDHEPPLGLGRIALRAGLGEMREPGPHVGEPLRRRLTPAAPGAARLRAALGGVWSGLLRPRHCRHLPDTVGRTVDHLSSEVDMAMGRCLRRRIPAGCHA